MQQTNFQTANPFAALASMFKPLPVMKLAAIWLTKPIVIGERTTRRISAGDCIAIKDGAIVDCTANPTHMIKECRGTATDQFEITVLDIKTQEETILKL